MDAFEAAKAALPQDRWLELRYEDLVADPRGVVAEVLGHLGLAWTPSFEEGFRRYRFDAGRADAYRRDLGIHDVAMLEAALTPALQRYGYAEAPTTTRAARARRREGDAR
jgi:hypothetical protein